MMRTPSIPLMALVVVAGALAAGIAADASALDQRIDGLFPVSDTTSLAATQATGQGTNGTVDTVHLAIEPAGAGQVDLEALSVIDAEGRELATELKPLRDEDGSLAAGVLGEGDLARLSVSLASPMEGGEERILVFDDGTASPVEVTITAPPALEDAYTRLALD